MSPDATAWPQELQRNAYFRRQGVGAGTIGDFQSLKRLRTDLQDFSPHDGQYYPARNALIRVYQYLIAKYDLDNHDQTQRFCYRDPNAPHRYDPQVTLGLGCLFALQGIPCLYYGTEQGLNGAVDSNGSDADVRDSLWGKNWPNAFDRSHRFYQALQRLSAVRTAQPALRYGRQYFRPISGDPINFGISHYPQGMLAFARILSDHEVLVAANTNPETGWDGDVIVDFALNQPGTPYEILFSNVDVGSRDPEAVPERGGNGLVIHAADGSLSNGPVRVVPVHLGPMEIQYLSRVRSASTRTLAGSFVIATPAHAVGQSPLRPAMTV